MSVLTGSGVSGDGVHNSAYRRRGEGAGSVAGQVERTCRQRIRVASGHGSACVNPRVSWRRETVRATRYRVTRYESSSRREVQRSRTSCRQKRVIIMNKSSIILLLLISLK